MRTYAREQVAQVVENYRNALISDPRVGESSCRLMMTAADEVLRRLDALPNSERRLAVTLGESCAGDAGDGKCTLAYPHAGECALPNPPAVPESSTNPLHGAEVPAGTLVETFPGSPFVRLEPRPRAMTPVPAVPALKAESHYRCADPDCEAPERPEPTAPEVVWTSDWMRVLTDGTCQRTWPGAGGVWSDCTSTVLRTLARALAEAKREAEGMRGERDAEREIAQEWEAKAHEATRGQRCDHGQPKEYCAQSLNDAVDSAKARGAESMRERAAAESERLGRQWGILRSMKMTEHANAAMEVAAAIRALSLEEP